MNRKIILSESEKSIILSMHKRTINNEHINEELTSPGPDLERIRKIADEIEKSMGILNTDEDAFVKAICKCKTYSDIFELDSELERRNNSAGGGELQYIINVAIRDGFTAMGSDTKERIKIKDCLNKASNITFQRDIATIKDNKIKIDWSMSKP
jgi:hypothetical protein